MTNNISEKIKEIALKTIADQQAETLVSSSRDNLLYLMGFNDGVINFINNLLSSDILINKK